MKKLMDMKRGDDYVKDIIEKIKHGMMTDFSDHCKIAAVAERYGFTKDNKVYLDSRHPVDLSLKRLIEEDFFDRTIVWDVTESIIMNDILYWDVTHSTRMADMAEKWGFQLGEKVYIDFRDFNFSIYPPEPAEEKSLLH